jgi:hypothetical protein
MRQLRRLLETQRLQARGHSVRLAQVRLQHKQFAEV